MINVYFIKNTILMIKKKKITKIIHRYKNLPRKRKNRGLGNFLLPYTSTIYG